MFGNSNNCRGLTEHPQISVEVGGYARNSTFVTGVPAVLDLVLAHIVDLRSKKPSERIPNRL